MENQVNETLSRLVNTLTVEEERVLLSLIKLLKGLDRVHINATQICREHYIARSVFTSTVRILEVVGLFSTRSMGAKGTMITDINKSYINALAEYYESAM